MYQKFNALRTRTSKRLARPAKIPAIKHLVHGLEHRGTLPHGNCGYIAFAKAYNSTLLEDEEQLSEDPYDLRLFFGEISCLKISFLRRLFDCGMIW